ncbi:hypothetical protein RSK20926_01527 [Roseobacter sp. SK209-2-6]|uniref:DUF6931 family protein n=1 Tax=Roseobacter sp. SK209-2-6 TaxID=388739 RepID=UPI0000F3DEA8|nr:hypothetical protein [Roseobacter sp. SK209-2-6]EBA14509.1 hypothetical protein RSK20926_01527 [Roseobacter sp. SK209-2-6]
MSERFENLIKLPPDPVAKLLSRANVILKTPLEAPPTAAAPAVLEELVQKGALVDLLRLLAILLPPRERVWWACMAARDYIGPRSPKDPPSLTTSEAWVREPNEENRDAARVTLDHAYIDDDTVNCALAVLYADGTLGPGDLKQYPAPAGASEAAAFAMNMVALGQLSDKFEEHGQVLVERALDIARGGNGQGSAKPAAAEQEQ